MFAENHSSGKHMVCDIRNIQNRFLLNDAEELKNLLKTLCIDFEYKILETWFKTLLDMLEK